VRNGRSKSGCGPPPARPRPGSSSAAGTDCGRAPARSSAT
jgi:hypothetical protein